MKTDKKILILAGPGLSTNIIFNSIHRGFGVHTIIVENKESITLFLKRRIKKLGIVQVAGQLVLQAMLVPFLRRSSSKYMKSLVPEGLAKEIDPGKIKNVNSVNDPTVAELVKAIEPDVVVVNGTRIISKKILSAIKCPVINMHAGITPMYRGVHGAYWALANGDSQHCGVTVHLVDAGVDTGDVLYQEKVEVNKKDNFVTYPLKQLLAGLPILNQAISDALNLSINAYRPAGNSGQWYHPTIWKYLKLRFSKGVK